MTVAAARAARAGADPAPTNPQLTERRHIDLLRVVTAACLG